MKNSFFNKENFYEIDTSPDKEKARLDAILKSVNEDPPYCILVASDLHLGPGREPVTEMYDATDNFLADEAFARWLNFYGKEAGRGALLVLNGDVFDFWRISKIPKDPDDISKWADYLENLGELEKSQKVGLLLSPSESRKRDRKKIINCKERMFGLKTNDFKSIWKLQVMMEGHVEVFQALFTWVCRGGRIVIVKGNHDLELHWPLVKKAIRIAIASNKARCDKKELNDRIAFSENKITIRNLHLEHGHEYHAFDAVDGHTILEKYSDEICLPLGAFISRYFVNKMERLSPFMDNMRPQSEALLTILRRHPLKVFGSVFRGWFFMWRVYKLKKILPVSALGILLLITVALPLVAVPLGFLLLFLDVFFDIEAIEWWICLCAAIPPFLAPYVLAAIFEIWRETLWFGRWLRKKEKRDRFLEKVGEKLRDNLNLDPNAKRHYAVMGHSHKQRVSLINTGPPELYYADSGTWTPLWPKDRPDLMGQILHSFLVFKFRYGEYRHRSKIWDDSAEHPRRAWMMVPPSDKH